MNHFFFGGGQDFFLTQSQTNAILSSPNTAADPQFDFGIGRLNVNPNAGSIDTFDFDPQPFGQRSLVGEIATRTANVIGGAPLVGQPFNILPAGGQCGP